MKPLIFDTLGGLSAPAVRLLSSISNKGHISSSRNPRKFVDDAIAAISVAIQEDNTAMVMKCFERARP